MRTARPCGFGGDSQGPGFGVGIARPCGFGDDPRVPGNVPMRRVFHTGLVQVGLLGILVGSVGPQHAFLLDRNACVQSIDQFMWRTDGENLGLGLSGSGAAPCAPVCFSAQCLENVSAVYNLFHGVKVLRRTMLTLDEIVCQACARFANDGEEATVSRRIEFCCRQCIDRFVSRPHVVLG